MLPVVSELKLQLKYLIRFFRDTFRTTSLKSKNSPKSGKYQLTIMGIECELPPLRSLDDFVLGSARFQMPNIQDMDKWGNRVTKNFLYYQTNYFVFGAVLMVLFALYNPGQTALGVSSVALLIGAFIYINPSKIQGQPQNQQYAGTTGWLYLGGLLAAAYFILYIFSAVLYVALIVLLPFCISFLHASFRLRNLKNKLSNVIDERLRYTPMGVFLEAMSITVESIATK